MIARDANFVLRSSLDTWCSQKQRLRSVSSGKEVWSCAEPQGSAFRFNPINQVTIEIVKLLLKVRVKRMDGLPAQFYRS